MPPRQHCPRCQAKLTTQERDRLHRSGVCPRCGRASLMAEDEPPPAFGPGLGWLLAGGAALLAVAVLVGGWLMLPHAPGRPKSEPSGTKAPADPPMATRSSSDPPRTPGSPEPAEMPGNCALLVGVRDYDAAKFPELKYTENDVEDLAEVLLRPDSAFASVRLLTTSRAKTRAADAPTVANIRAAAKALLKGKKRDDVVLIALSGHGLSWQDDKTGKDESFFCPSDAQLNDRDTLVSLDELFRQLDDCGAGAKLLLVDACRDDPRSSRSINANRPPPPQGIAALFSCSSGQRAFETAKLGGKGHGVFFHFVLEGLRGKAVNEDKEVTWLRLSEYVTRQVEDTVPSLIGGGAKQIPHPVSNLPGKSPVLFRAGGRWKMLLESGRRQLEQHLHGPAARTLGEAIDLAPNEPLPRAYRALALALERRFTEALADCDLALKKDDRCAVAWAVRGRVLAVQKKPDQGLADCETAVRLDATSGLVRACRGFAYLKKGRPAQALVDCEEAVKLAPTLALAYCDRGGCHLASKDYDRAIADFNEAARLAPKYAAAHNELGKAHLAKKEIDRAITDFEAAMRLDPLDAEPYLNRADAYNRKKDIDKALADCEQAMKLDPASARPYNYRGHVYAARREPEKALADFNEAIRRDADYAAAYRNRGRLYLYDKGDADKALADFDKAIDLSPSYADAYYDRGHVRAGLLKDLDRAITDFSAAIRLDPTLPWFYHDRGGAYMDKRMYDQAIADFTQALKLDPNYILAYQNRGAAHANKRQYDQAIADYTAAMKLDRKYAPAYKLRAEAYQARKDFEAARRDQEEYLRLTGKK